MNPDIRFYEEEFFTVTQRLVPKSAKFVRTSASFPDLHGDYCSSSQILLSRDDYQWLLKQVGLDTGMVKIPKATGFEEFQVTLEEKKASRMVAMFVRKSGEITERYLFIGFYEDLQTVFVNVCKT